MKISRSWLAGVGIFFVLILCFPALNIGIAASARQQKIKSRKIPWLVLLAFLGIGAIMIAAFSPIIGHTGLVLAITGTIYLVMGLCHKMFLWQT